MALFTDGPPATIDDLVAHDSQLLTVSNGEGIDLTQKLALAHEEVGLDLRTMLGRLGPLHQALWLAARLDLKNVAVTPALKLWHTFRALEMVYADAFNSQLNDRYRGKRDQYHKEARWARDRVVENGLGVVEDPVGKAATPVVTNVTGKMPDGTYYVTMAWANAAGEEGCSAPPGMVTTISSSIAVQPAESAPENAAGWNVYIGPAPDAMIKQNASPVAASATWIQPSEVETTGQHAGCGQQPTYIRSIPRMIGRG